MTLTPSQLKEVRKAAKDLGVNIKIDKQIGQGFWMDECNQSIAGFIEWLASQAKKDQVRISTARYGVPLSEFEIETSTELALLLTYIPYCESKWVPKSLIITINGTPVVPYAALK